MKCLISLFNHIGIKIVNQKESESDKIQTIPNLTCDTANVSASDLESDNYSDYTVTAK